LAAVGGWGPSLLIKFCQMSLVWSLVLIMVVLAG